MEQTEQRVVKALKEFKEWLDTGLPDHPVFNRDWAICRNIETYFYPEGHNGENCPDYEKVENALDLLYQEHNPSLNDAGILCPFNIKEDVPSWTDELYEDSFYSNKYRLDFLNWIVTNK